MIRSYRPMIGLLLSTALLVGCDLPAHTPSLNLVFAGSSKSEVRIRHDGHDQRWRYRHDDNGGHSEDHNGGWSSDDSNEDH